VRSFLRVKYATTGRFSTSFCRALFQIDAFCL
jgi:hypothetical protein